MIELTINLDGVDALKKMFTVKIPRVLSDLRPEMARVGRIIQDRFFAVFRAQGAVGGLDQWAPLSPKWTVPEREREGFGGEHPILVRTTSYRRSFRVIEVSDFGVRVGSEDVRDTRLQLGGRTPLSTVPARTITARVRGAFESEHWVEVTDAVADGLIERWRKEGAPLSKAA